MSSNNPDIWKKELRTGFAYIKNALLFDSLKGEFPVKLFFLSLVLTNCALSLIYSLIKKTYIYSVSYLDFINTFDNIKDRLYEITYNESLARDFSVKFITLMSEHGREIILSAYMPFITFMAVTLLMTPYISALLRERKVEGDTSGRKPSKGFIPLFFMFLLLSPVLILFVESQTLPGALLYPVVFIYFGYSVNFYFDNEISLVSSLGLGGKLLRCSFVRVFFMFVLFEFLLSAVSVFGVNFFIQSNRDYLILFIISFLNVITRITEFRFITLVFGDLTKGIDEEKGEDYKNEG